MKMYIFDFDDTMIDNFLMDFESFRTVVESADCKMISKERLREMREKGLLAGDIMRGIAPKYAETLFKKRKALVMSSHFLEYAMVRKHVKETCAKIKNAGHLVCIATRRMNRRRIQEFLEKEKLSQYITEMLCGDDVKGTPEEIKREMYQQLLKKYHMRPEDTIVIGNSESDLLPAHQLGIRTVAVDGTYTKKELIAAETHADFKMLGEMIER